MSGAAQAAPSWAKGVVLVKGQPIQWHRKQSSHDRCPKCGGPVGYLGRKRRMCMGECRDGFTRELLVEPQVWLQSLGFNEAEVAVLLKADSTTKGRRPAIYVEPGFLYVEAS